jgi:L-lactate dehydrogenase complex protein LldF
MAIITNEGNGRFCTSVPPVHIAVMGLEKAVPRTEDLALISSLLPRAALGWPLSSYVSWTRAPAGLGGGQGPREFHLVILDNGRSRALDSPFWEILLCLRCSSCLNYCPVYSRAGGHAYRSVYAGPMGSVLTPLLRGEKGDRSLARASTLCGRCREACPVGIDLPGLLLKLRQQEAESTPTKRLLPRLGAEMLSHRASWEAACRLAKPFTGALRALPESALPPGPWRGWRRGRRLPRFGGSTLVGRSRRREGGRE